MKRRHKIQILECTLRDGSYAIDYQFNAEDTAVIAAALEQAGFELIEIGHGLGLNASSQKFGFAAASDEEYLEIAASVLKKAKYGTFFIPGIGRMKDLQLAHKYNMGFVRVGTNVTDVEQAEPYIKKAKQLGMLVFSNLMKSYALSVDDFIKKASLAALYGADVVVVVDSAGGMLPEEVRNYVTRIRNEIGVRVGFHGHNNLLLAVANSIEAVRAGAEIVDSSLQGMGRSAGNAQTEILLILLEKLGYKMEIDLFKAMDIGDKIIKPMMGGEKGIDSISATLGYAQFHSSYLKIILKIARQYDIDPRKLVTKVSEVDKVRVSEELAEKVARQIAGEERNRRISWNINFDFSTLIEKSKTPTETARTLALEMLSLGKKAGKRTVFTIAPTRDKKKKSASFPFIRQNAAHIIGNAEVSNAQQAVQIALAIDGYADYILVDSDPRNKTMADKVRNTVKKSIVLFYNDIDAHMNAVEKMLWQLLGSLKQKKIVIIGNNRIVRKLADKLANLGAKVVNKGGIVHGVHIDVLIGLEPFRPSVTVEDIQKVKKNGVILDAGPGSIREDAIKEAHGLGHTIYRVDMRAGLSGEVVSVVETYELKNKIIGQKEIVGLPIIAGGILGNRGDIIVDSITNPTRIIGVADGKGCFLKGKELRPFSNSIKKVRSEIARMRFLG